MKAFLAWSQDEHKEHPGTFQRYRTSSKPLLVFLKFKNKVIDEISPGDIEEYKARRSPRSSASEPGVPIKPATINRELACLKAMFFHALKDRHAFKQPGF